MALLLSNLRDIISQGSIESVILLLKNYIEYKQVENVFVYSLNPVYSVLAEAVLCKPMEKYINVRLYKNIYLFNTCFLSKLYILTLTVI